MTPTTHRPGQIPRLPKDRPKKINFAEIEIVNDIRSEVVSICPTCKTPITILHDASGGLLSDVRECGKCKKAFVVLVGKRIPEEHASEIAKVEEIDRPIDSLGSFGEMVSLEELSEESSYRGYVIVAVIAILVVLIGIVSFYLWDDSTPWLTKVPPKQYSITTGQPSQSAGNAGDVEIKPVAPIQSEGNIVTGDSTTLATILVSVFAQEDCWVSIEIDGNKRYEGFMSPADTITRPSDITVAGGKKISILEGKPGCLHFVLNGKDVSPANVATHPDKIGEYVFTPVPEQD